MPGAKPYSDSVAPATPLSESSEGPGEKLAAVLDVLACPACYQPLRASAAGVACTGCGRVYPLVDDIPVLLVDRANLPE